MLGKILLFTLLLFLAVLSLRALFIGRKARKLTPTPAPPEETSLVYAQKLQKMIQCATVSNDGAPKKAEFQKLNAAVKTLFPLLHQKAEKMVFGDDCWLYHIKGSDQSRSILLMSHHDVVAAEGDWRYPPFSGEIAEGKLWGRGAIDTKTPLFAELMAVEELLENGSTPPCDLYIASSHNEETSGDGIPKVLEYFKEKGIALEVVLDEGGAVAKLPKTKLLRCEKAAMVAVHEKGRCYITCNAEGTTGHSSFTSMTGKPPMVRMNEFMKSTAKEGLFLRRLNRETKATLLSAAPYCSFPLRLVLGNLPIFSGLLKRVAPKVNGELAGFLGTTVLFNRIEGDSFHCTAKGVLRFVDEADFEHDFERFCRLAERHGISVTVTDREFAPPADMTLPPFRCLQECIAAVFPDAAVIPFILPAATDARTLTEVCPCVLRFAPITLSLEQLAAVHGKDENIDLASIAEAVEFYRYFLTHYQ